MLVQGFVMTDSQILHLLTTLGAGEFGQLDFGMFLQLCLHQAEVGEHVQDSLLYTWKNELSWSCRSWTNSGEKLPRRWRRKRPTCHNSILIHSKSYSDVVIV